MELPPSGRLLLPASASLSVPAARGATLSDYLALAKPRITLMVVLTALMGYLCSGSTGKSGTVLFAALFGTALVAAGASVLNMLLERVRDARMERTRSRPLPAGRLRPVEALVFGLGLTLLGLLLLAVMAGPLPGAVALATWVSYVFLYTPLKPHTSLATVVGAVPGALPPVIGWAAAQGRLDAGAWLLFAILFLWQIPHFLAIAWIYREDYRRGGFPMLPVVEAEGRMTARQALANSLALVPVSLTPTVAGMAGRLYFVGALLLGLTYVFYSARLLLLRNALAARSLFLFSILYLPALAALLLFDRG